MSEKVYRNLFILCVIFSQGIVGSFLEDDTGESSNLLVREKRVINRIAGEDGSVETVKTPYIVNIKQNNHVECVGAILSHRTVITASRCVLFDVSVYKVFSGSKYSYQGMPHDVTGKKIHRDYHQFRGSISMTSIALIFVHPAFVYGVHTESINLHTGLVVAGMHGTVSGWGSHIHGGPRESVRPKRIRSITLPIMSHQSCVNSYKGFFQIGDDYICTFDEQKQCGATDAGAPLIIDNELAAVHVGVIETLEKKGCHFKPDVYALLQHRDYSSWITSNILH